MNDTCHARGKGLFTGRHYEFGVWCIVVLQMRMTFLL